MTVWQGYVNSFMEDLLCWDAAIVSIPQQRLLCACPGGILAKVTEPEIQALLDQNRNILLTQGLTLGGLQCMVIRDHLYTEAQQYTMDLQMKVSEDGGKTCTRAITVVLVNPMCLIVIGERGIQGGMLNMRVLRVAQSIKDYVAMKKCRG